MGITKQKRGFTFIEVVVVMGVIALILPALFSIVFGILRQQTKLYKLTEVKREGDYALSYMKNIMQVQATGLFADAGATIPICASLGENYSGTLYFFDEAGTSYTFSIADRTTGGKPERLALVVDKSGESAKDLTSQEVMISAGSFSLSCERLATFSTPLIRLSFIVSGYPPPTHPEDRAQITFQTSFKIRTYDPLSNP